MPVNTIYSDGDNSQLRQVIFDATPKAIEQTKNIARQFKGADDLQTCKKVFDYLKTRINYSADGFHQKVKLPSALLRERVGDCKSYSVFTYAILSNLGIPCKYVLTSYSNDPTPSHIYVVTDSGIIIDAVWGVFNSEKPATYKYYKKIDDMRISTITGINNVQIGCSSCSGKMGATAEQWYDANKQSLGLGVKQKAIHLGAKAPTAPLRLLFYEFIKNNSGGIATSIYKKIYERIDLGGTQLNVPEAEYQALNNAIRSNATKLGVKLPTDVQRNQISMLSSVKVSTPSNSGGVLLPSNTTGQSAMALDYAWDSVMGTGQYSLYKKYVDDAIVKGTAELQAKYKVPMVNQNDLNNWNKFLKQWYLIGGNPDEIKESVYTGKNKRPQGRTANYMLMIAKTRGLKVKDIGLIIRGFVDAFSGKEFTWGEDGTYIFGTQNKGIGEVTIATISAYIGVITTLFGILAQIWDFVESKIAKSKAREEADKLETSGYMLDKDYFTLPTPRLKVIDVKQVAMPTAEAPSLADIGSFVDALAQAFPPKQSQVATVPTKEEIEAKEKQGSFAPFMSQAVQDAKKDPNTLGALQKITTLAQSGSKLVPTAGTTVLTYVKVDEKDVEGEGGSGSGSGLMLPLILGAGALLILSKK
jgi:hypothetical protein